LREREKLKHLQYKLNERVDVLRAMEPTAFLALPATDFSPAPPPPPVAEDGDVLHANGAPAHREGLRRRDEMLANARVLAEKYAQLLPPDRPRPPTKKNAMDDTDDEVPAPSALKKAPSKARGMAVFVSAPAEEWEVDDGSEDEFRPEVKKGKKRPKSGKAKGPAPEAVAVAASMSMSMSASTSQADPMDIDGPPPTASPPPSPPSSKPNGKRRHASSPAPTVETSASASVALSTKPKRKPQQRAPTLCHLERAAQHRASGRRAPRNVQPFGMDIPGSLELRLLFDFPAWAHPQDRDSGWAARDGEDHMVGDDGNEDEEEDGDPPDIVGIVPAATPPPPQPQPVSRPGRGRKPKAKPALVVESGRGRAAQGAPDGPVHGRTRPALVDSAGTRCADVAQARFSGGPRRSGDADTAISRQVISDTQLYRSHHYRPASSAPIFSFSLLFCSVAVLCCLGSLK
jgi:hypothetical protein